MYTCDDGTDATRIVRGVVDRSAGAPGMTSLGMTSLGDAVTTHLFCSSVVRYVCLPPVFRMRVNPEKAWGLTNAPHDR